jgi:hypothetical protein
MGYDMSGTADQSSAAIPFQAAAPPPTASCNPPPFPVIRWVRPTAAAIFSAAAAGLLCTLLSTDRVFLCVLTMRLFLLWVVRSVLLETSHFQYGVPPQQQYSQQVQNSKSDLISREEEEAGCSGARSSHIFRCSHSRHNSKVVPGEEEWTLALLGTVSILCLYVSFCLSLFSSLLFSSLLSKCSFLCTSHTIRLFMFQATTDSLSRHLWVAQLREQVVLEETNGSDSQAPLLMSLLPLSLSCFEGGGCRSY